MIKYEIDTIMHILVPGTVNKNYDQWVYIIPKNCPIYPAGLTIANIEKFTIEADTMSLPIRNKFLQAGKILVFSKDTS